MWQENPVSSVIITSSTDPAMKTTHALAAAILSTSTCLSQAGTEAGAATAPQTNNGSFMDGIHLFGNARLRYEYADLDGFDESYLGSLRVRYGIKTDSISGFKFLVEGESTVVLTDKKRYSPFPGFLNGRRTVIADPDNFELNRLQLSYEAKEIDTTITVGRQHINLADQRFVGAVGWRQNDQTYDAVVLENKSIDNLTITYAFIDQVNRIFGEDTPARALDYWNSSSHLVHLEFTGIENHTLRAFAYLLDFKMSSPANSSDTYGLELAGKRELASGNTLTYLLTAAIQQDAGRNAAHYTEHYYRAQAGLENDCYNAGVGVEVLTSDGTNSFRMPLGTNHKFNGFADAFLTTPGTGLVDYYSWIGTKAFGFSHKLIAHHFHSESGGVNIGWEVDYVAARKISENARIVLKGAHLMGRGAQRDLTRASAEINYAF